MRPRWVSFVCLTAGLLALGWGAIWILAERQFQAGLKKARAEIESRQFDTAARRLASLSARRPSDAEAAFLLGVCEYSTGRREEALSAWARVAPESRFAADAAVARALALVSDFSRFSDAELVLGGALAKFGPRAPQIRYSLNQLYYWQGRIDEMRRLLQETWNTSPDQAGDLRDLWMIDSAVVMVEPVQSAVLQATRKAPDDDRVWLASANLALLGGRYPEAARWLDACLGRRPADPVVWRARLRWARAAESIDEARRTLSHLPADQFSRTDLLALRAWFAARLGHVETERAALEQVIELAPGDTQSWERLAALATMAGQSQRATELRRRKAEMDRAKERYFRLLEPGKPISQFTELAGLAKMLGREFEARGWRLLAARQPPKVFVTAATERPEPPRPDIHLPAGNTLDFYLGDGAPLAAGESRPGNGRAPVQLETTPSPPEWSSSMIMDGRYFTSFRRQRQEASVSWITTVTDGSTFMLSRGVHFLRCNLVAQSIKASPGAGRISLRPAIDCTATAAMARLKTPPNDPASLG